MCFTALYIILSRDELLLKVCFFSGPEFLVDLLVEIFRNVEKYNPRRYTSIIDRMIPGDSGQTQLRSICLKFAGPEIRITGHLPRPFLE